MLRKRAYRSPVQDWVGRTFVNVPSALGLETPNPHFEDKGQSNNSWPIPEGRKREKERPIPLPSDHAKNRDKVIGPTYYNKNDYIPTRTKSIPGEQYGHPAKMDYNYPTRRKFSIQGDEGSSPFIRKPKDRQKHQKGVSKAKSKLYYLKNRAKLKPLRRKYWRKKKRDPNTKRKRKYYQMYKNVRFKRKGRSPYMTPAERTKAWREKQKKKASSPGTRGPTEGLMFVKKTEPPAGTTTTSLRAPNLQNKPQPGLFRDNIPHGESWPNEERHQNTSNGFGKVLPQNWSDSQMVNNKVVPKDNRQERVLKNRMAKRVAMRFLYGHSWLSRIQKRLPITTLTEFEDLFYAAGKALSWRNEYKREEEIGKVERKEERNFRTKAKLKGYSKQEIQEAVDEAFVREYHDLEYYENQDEEYDEDD